MKHLIILLLFGLASCHIHYHIEPKEKPKEVIKTNTDNYFSSNWCGVIGCCVYHGPPDKTYGGYTLNYLGKDWGWSDKVDTTIIKAGEVLTIRGTSRLTDIIVNAATPHTEKEKTIYKSLKDTLK